MPAHMVKIMYTVEYDEDGTKVLKYKPLEGIPFYGDWKRFLETRPTMYSLTPQGQAVLTCLACGNTFRKLDLGCEARVGCRIQIQERHPHASDPNTIVVTYRITPVRKSGVVCQPCGDEFVAEESQVIAYNALMWKLGSIKSKLATLKGEQLKESFPNKREAYLDVSRLVLNGME